MYPFLLKYPIELPSYFTMLMVAFIVGIYISWRNASEAGIKRIDLLDFSIVILLASLFGARILHVFVDGHFSDYVNMCIDPFKVDEAARYIAGGCKSDAMCDNAGVGNICNITTGYCYQKDCFAALQFWRGGLVYYGGFIGALIASFFFLRRRNVKIFKMADLVSPALALGLSIGRVGCYLAGCCFGKHTNSFLGIVFPHNSPAHKKHLELYPDIMDHRYHALPVFPTQLFEAIAVMLIFFYLLFYLRKRVKYTGQMFIQFMVLYSIVRFIIEFFRDDDRGIFGFFSTSQWIGIVIVIVSFFISKYLKKRHIQ